MTHPSQNDGTAPGPILDPSHEIIDPHIHIWAREVNGPYLVPDLSNDLNSGHAVTQTLYVECGERYFANGPDHLKTIGEAEYAAQCASVEPRITGMIGKMDLSTGSDIQLAIDGFRQSVGSFIKGTRHAAAHDPHRDALQNPGKAPAGLLSSGAARSAVRVLGKNNLISEHWVFFHQIDEVTRLARAAPDTVFVLNHLGTPLGVGPYRTDAGGVWSSWRTALRDLALCPNVFLKIGGLGMPDVGIQWKEDPTAPTHETIAAAWRPWIETGIETFGPDRCMFESNFPVDGGALSYPTLWNVFKFVTKACSSDERTALFSGTARKVYQL